MSWRLLLALAASVLVHFMLVYGANFSLPDWSQEEDRIEVSLAPLPHPKPVLLPRSVPAKARPVAAKPEAPARQPDLPRHEAPPPAPVEPGPAATPPPVVEDSPAPAAEPVSVEPIPPQEEPVAVAPPPARVEIDFQLYRGKLESGSLGKVKQVFRLEQDNRYTLHSVAEASGLVSLFVSGKFEERSDGQVTERGLRPRNFRQQRGSPDKVQSASFDWETNTVALEYGSKHNVVEVQDGTQDMLSFMYQFMFVPPLDEMRITVANGRKLKTYAYSFEGEQQVETRMGKLRAWHIARAAAEGEEKTELWLAVDYRHLPIKIRQTDKDGTVTEQIATRLLLE